MRILGIEGTAWAASAAVFDVEADEVWIETDAYVPESGGIDPREAADHMADAIPEVVAAALEYARELDADARENADREADDAPAVDVEERSSSGRRAPPVDVAEGTSAGQQAPPVDAVAFSRGPGLGPCLRIVGTAARALAGTLDVPLVGVNHMVAHLEIGRHRSGFDSPVCLNASGANAHVLGYRDGRYRVLGETMDVGVGNALDKFARHVGWSHPGGPKIEEAAVDGEYVELPYVVKGMDFSFSGITTATQETYDEGVPVEDLCFSLQETVFAMLAEVAERALSLTGSDELVLGGGVGQNARLRGMLEEMCEDRGAAFFAPEARFLRDNAGMIAVLGAKMYEAGDTLDIAESAVDPDFRPDEAPVTWRSGESVSRAGRVIEDGEVQGAEAIVTVEDDRVIKRRVPKSYRHPALDDRLRRERTAAEARLTSLARREGVPTPAVLDVDPVEATLAFEYVGDRDLRESPTLDRIRAVGGHLATLHAAGMVHGDPTPRNVRIEDDDDRISLVDFGLAYHADHVEDLAMDLHVFEGSLGGTAVNPGDARDAVEAGYRGADVDLDAEAVLDRLREIERRGRYQS